MVNIGKYLSIQVCSIVLESLDSTIIIDYDSSMNSEHVKQYAKFCFLNLDIIKKVNMLL